MIDRPRHRTSAPQPRAMVTALAQLRFAGVFNPYADVCPRHDLHDAPAIRRRNLLLTLTAAQDGVDDLWIALEPGHKGARRTGLAMTDDRNLQAHAERWGIEGVRPATLSGPVREQTAGVVWEALATCDRRVFLWNVFPLHCHTPGEILSNRRHTRAERTACADLTDSVIELLRPRRIIAIGREAAAAMAEAGRGCLAVRHPAHGGKAAFLDGVRRR